VSMTLYVITYDVRAKNPEYQSLYDQLNEWGAAHLQNSVWLADMNGTAAAVRDALRRHLHPDDRVCVIQIFSNSDWATWKARKTGTDWLTSHTK
jgi:CRISPR/Cas system-associated endoribonuclease Cas2